MAIALGGYRLIGTLGRGGMAEVFLAVRRGVVGFHKLVVIKRLRTDLLDKPDADRYHELLLDEARLAARLQHPNIVQTFEVDEAGGRPFLAMEYLEGQTLGQVCARARKRGAAVPVEYALRIVGDVLSALDHAHELHDYDGASLGVVHRDVSPQNIFWTYDGQIKLMDFGVAKFALGSTHTEAGVIKGKLTYMAPEQARGEPIDRRADVFAVGIILWELVTGRRLLRTDSDAATLQRLLFEPLPALDAIAPDVDPEIARICALALDRDPSRRYPTAAVMREDLEHVLGVLGPRREDLAAFVTALFEHERKQVSAQIREVLQREGEERALLALGGPADAPLSKGSRSTAAARASGATPVSGTPAPSGASAALVRLGGRETRATRPGAERPTQLDARTPAPTTPPPGAIARARTGWGVLAAGLAALVIGGSALGWRLLDRGGDGAAAPLPGGAAPGPAGLASTADPASAPATATAAPPPALRLCGSNTIGAELAPALVDAWLRRKGAPAVNRRPGARDEELTLSGAELAVEVRAHGSATAFEGLADGSCDLGMASRAINDKEQAALDRAGLGDLRAPGSEHVIALDGIAVIVNPNNPIASLDRTTLHDIFTGAITDWAQVGGPAGPITVLARDDKSGTFDTFKNLVLDKSALPAGTRRFADSNQLADTVAGDPSAIGFIGLAYVRSAKAIAVGDRGARPMLPTSFTVTTEDYMLSRRLYFYTTAKPRTPLVAELVSFALSSPGQQVVEKAGFVDLQVGMRDGDRCGPACPRAYAAAIAGAQRLSLDFRFRAGSDGLDSRAARDLDRTVLFLRDHPGARLMLFGFSDNVGDPRGNLRLSIGRAQAIARELELRGVHPAAVAGFGAALPIASNATDADRQRNRRVEVWLHP